MTYVAPVYLTPEDKGAFQDIEIKINPAIRDAKNAESEIASLKRRLDPETAPGWGNNDPDFINERIAGGQRLIDNVEKRSLEYVHCPVCRGHGNWNLRLDAYGPGQHFQAFCSQCSGYGWVRRGSANETCVHKWRDITPSPAPYSCWHLEKCTGCGQEREVDSSG